MNEHFRTKTQNNQESNFAFFFKVQFNFWISGGTTTRQNKAVEGVKHGNHGNANTNYFLFRKY